MRRTANVARKRNSLAHGMGLFHTKHPGRLTVMSVSADLDPALTHYAAWSLHALQEVRATLVALRAHPERS